MKKSSSISQMRDVQQKQKTQSFNSKNIPLKTERSGQTIVTHRQQIALIEQQFELPPSECIFCQKLKKSQGKFGPLLHQALYSQFATSQNYYFTKQINLIFSPQRNLFKLQYREQVFLDNVEEYFSRYYNKIDAKQKLPNLLQYYKYHTDAPRFFDVYLLRISERYYTKHRKIEYQRVKKLLNYKDESDLEQEKQQKKLQDKDIENCVLKDLDYSLNPKKPHSQTQDGAKSQKQTVHILIEENPSKENGKNQTKSIGSKQNNSKTNISMSVIDIRAELSRIINFQMDQKGSDNNDKSFLGQIYENPLINDYRPFILQDLSVIENQQKSGKGSQFAIKNLSPKKFNQLIEHQVGKQIENDSDQLKVKTNNLFQNENSHVLTINNNQQKKQPNYTPSSTLNINYNINVNVNNLLANTNTNQANLHRYDSQGQILLQPTNSHENNQMKNSKINDKNKNIIDQGLAQSQYSIPNNNFNNTNIINLNSNYNNTNNINANTNNNNRDNLYNQNSLYIESTPKSQQKGDEQRKKDISKLTGDKDVKSPNVNDKLFKINLPIPQDIREEFNAQISSQPDITQIQINKNFNYNPIKITSVNTNNNVNTNYLTNNNLGKAAGINAGVANNSSNNMPNGYQNISNNINGSIIVNNNLNNVNNNTNNINGSMYTNSNNSNNVIPYNNNTNFSNANNQSNVKSPPRILKNTPSFSPEKMNMAFTNYNMQFVNSGAETERYRKPDFIEMKDPRKMNEGNPALQQLNHIRISQNNFFENKRNSSKVNFDSNPQTEFIMSKKEEKIHFINQVSRVSSIEDPININNSIKTQQFVQNENQNFIQAPIEFNGLHGRTKSQEIIQVDYNFAVNHAISPRIDTQEKYLYQIKNPSAHNSDKSQSQLNKYKTYNDFKANTLSLLSQNNSNQNILQSQNIDSSEIANAPKSTEQIKSIFKPQKPIIQSQSQHIQIK